MTYEEATARTWLEVDEDALLANYNEAKRLCGEKTKLIAVLKADAYGYGARRIARVLYDHGVRHFAVACYTEAKELREVLPDAWILVMGVTPCVFLKDAITMELRLTVQTKQELRELSDAAVELGKQAKVHIKLDTGLHRLGFARAEDVPDLHDFPCVDIEGIFSHLALRSKAQSEEQFALFVKETSVLKTRNIPCSMLHIVDSIGLTRYNAWKLDAARVGAFLYGNVPPDYIRFDQRRAVGKLVTRIARIETVQAGEGIGYDDAPLTQARRVATLCAGYVDGYARSLSGVGEVEILNRRAKVLGLVCMDQMMVDVTDIPGAREGDEVVLLGGSIGVDEYAEWAGLNRNESLARTGKRVPRVYLENGQVVGVTEAME